MSERTARQLEDQLAARINRTVHVTVTQNRVRMISFKTVARVIQLRIHEKLLAAPPDVIEDLAAWLQKPGRGPGSGIREYINAIHEPESIDEIFAPAPSDTNGQMHLFDAPASCARPIDPSEDSEYTTKGEVYDLLELFERVNREYFDGRIRAHITWGRDTSHLRVRSRRLGSWHSCKRKITIHPLLDDRRVPEKVVTFTIYHEMLHSLQPSNHRRPHDKAFREKERAHPDYKEVMRWRKENTALLMGKRKR